MAESKALTPLQTVCANIEQMAPQFKAALPAGLAPERFVRTVLQGIQAHRDRDKLVNADRRTLYLACQKAAGDGLLLDGREATLAVFRNNDRGVDEVAYLPMVQGLMKLARNSGEIASVIAEVVYSKDKFTYRIGVDESPIHEPDWFTEDRGTPVGVWALVTLTSGHKVHAILPKAKVLRVAKASRNGYQYDPARGAHWDEWWKKTAIRNVLKYAPKSTELQRAIEHEDEAQGGDIYEPMDVTPQAPRPDLRVVDPDTGEVADEPAPRKRRTRAADAVAARKTAETAPPPETEPDADGPAGPADLEGDYQVVDEEQGAGDAGGDDDGDIPI